MKFAVITDIGRAVSYFANDGKVYRLSDGEPHHAPAFISNEWLMGFWNFPVLFNGEFINIKNTELPDIEYDLIFAAIEKDTRHIHSIKEKYPNAIVYGMAKEDYGNPSVRREVLNECVGYIQPFLTYDVIKTGDKPLIKLGQPINIEYLRHHFGGVKENTIFDYSNYWSRERYANNRPFLEKVNIPVTNGKTMSSDPNQILNFFHMWTGSQYMVNFDKVRSVGQMATQCAALNTIMLGGNNDSHSVLYPECSGMNHDHVYNSFDRMQRDKKYKQDIIDYAFNKLKELYSFSAVKEQILGLIN